MNDRKPFGNFEQATVVLRAAPNTYTDADREAAARYILSQRHLANEAVKADARALLDGKPIDRIDKLAAELRVIGAELQDKYRHGDLREVGELFERLADVIDLS